MAMMLKQWRWFVPIVLAAFLIGCAGSESKRATGEYIDDKVISTKVKSSLASELGAGSALDISVESYQGTVQLSGFVQTADEKQRAAEITKSVNGVKKVLNNIALRPAQSK
ncbi:MAG: BON domain-containing protein [Burkholderiales bacterium]